MKLCNFISKVKGLRYAEANINELEKKVEILFKMNQKLADDNMSLRLKEKAKNNEKIKVLFICHRPAVWGSLKSVYQALKQDTNFEVTILAIPNKKELPEMGLEHEIYESEGAEEFWKGENCVCGYNYDTKEWIDPKSFSPDYVFCQQPYNVAKSELYKSWMIGQYARLCYVAYATDFIGAGVLEETSPKDYLQNVYAYFTQNSIDDKLINNILRTQGNIFTKTQMTGFPRYDDLAQYQGMESNVWNYPKSERHFRVLWTPRWCTNEGNCSFFEYKDLMPDYIINHKEYDFVFRPHPQAFKNWQRTGEMPIEECNQYEARYEKAENMGIDKERDYFSTIFSSDCLISDVSSFIADYFMTGKPIIYCHKIDMFNELSSKMAEGFYWVKNWNELKDTLAMLQAGEDPLKVKREQILRELGMDKQNAGEQIKEYLLKDAGR